MLLHRDMVVKLEKMQTGEGALKPGGGKGRTRNKIFFRSLVCVKAWEGSLLLNRTVGVQALNRVTSVLLQAFFTLARDIKAKMDKKLVSNFYLVQSLFKEGKEKAKY